jgi:hypothetical protein
MSVVSLIAAQEKDRTNQNQKDEWRRFAPPLIFWFYTSIQQCLFIKSRNFEIRNEN